jgi:hypothetical protein
MSHAVDVPEHAPFQPAKTEVPSGTARSITRVPFLKTFPAGLLETLPWPLPVFDIVRVNWGIASPAWVSCGTSSGFAAETEINREAITQNSAPMAHGGPLGLFI